MVIIFGIAWLSDTIRSHHKHYLIEMISGVMNVYPWTVAIAMFVVSIFLKSQAAALTIILPLGFSLGIQHKVLPACYAYFFFSFYPGDLAP